MSTCDQVEELLADWVAGRLQDEAGLVALHVATCPGCGALAEEWRAMEALLDVQNPPAPDDAPAWLAERIVREVYTAGERAAQAQQVRARRLAWLALLLVAVVLGAVLIVWQRGTGAVSLFPDSPSLWLGLLIWICVGLALSYGLLIAEIDWAALWRRRLS